MIDVQGRCPACHRNTLFLGNGGHVTCSRLECPNPCAADELLHEAAAAEAYERAINTPPSAEACAAIRKRLESGDLPRRKARRNPALDQPGPAATQATEAAKSPLRDLIAAAIYERNNPAHRWADAHPDDLLAYGFDADAVLAVILPASTAHDEARGQVARVREAIAERRAEVADYEAENEPSAWSDAVTVTCNRIEDALRVFPEPVGIRVEPAHNDGPSVREAAADDRRWPLQKTGE